MPIPDIYIKELWQIIYDAFENAPGSAFRTVTGSNVQSNDIQFRLMRHLAEVRGGDMSKLAAVGADIDLARTLGIIPVQAYERASQILDELNT